MTMGIIVLIAGVWITGSSFVMKITGSNHFLSSIIFKFVPFLLGVSTLTVGAKMMGWI